MKNRWLLKEESLMMLYSSRICTNSARNSISNRRNIKRVSKLNKMSLEAENTISKIKWNFSRNQVITKIEDLVMRLN